MHGHVQGVFYRDWTTETAEALELAGWVRNRMDGTVEAHVEGDPDAVEAFIEKAYVGPSAAQVASIDINEAMVDGLSDFKRRATA